MQLTRVIYNGLMKCAGYIILSLFVFVNAVMVFISKSEYEQRLASQHQYLSSILAASPATLKSEQIGVLNDMLFGWRIYDAGDNEVFVFQSSVNEKEVEKTSAKVTLPEQTYRIDLLHKSFFQYYFQRFMLSNALLALVCLGGLAGTHRGVLKHWKVFIQIEAWASRFSREKDTKFFIKTHDYHLVNTIRKINNERIQAQKGNQKIDHLIRSQAFLDKLTGLGNRLYFDNRLEALLKQDAGVLGAVLLIQFNVLDELAEQIGKRATSHYVKNYASLLVPFLDDTQETIVARVGYSEFAILFPYVEPKALEGVALNIIEKSQRFALPKGYDQLRSCYIGVKTFNYTETPFHILAEVDLALRASQLHGPAGFFMYEAGALPDHEIKGSVRWRLTIENALENRDFKLFLDPVNDVDENCQFYDSVLHLIDENDKEIEPTVFLPMARNCGKIPAIDQAKLENVIQKLQSSDRKNKPVPAIATRLHLDSWHNREFNLWLVKFLKKHTALIPRIIFEFSEFELVNNVTQAKKLIKLIKRYQGQVMVSQVGLYVVDLGYLNKLEIDGLKLHQSIAKNLDGNRENELFIRSLVGVAATRHQQVFAIGIESAKQIKKIKQLGLSGFSKA